MDKYNTESERLTPHAVGNAEVPYDLLELAWGIIANAGGGDWDKESKEWQGAAIRWRDTYFGSLARVSVTLGEQPNTHTPPSMAHATGNAEPKEWELLSDGEDDVFAIIREVKSKRTIAANLPTIVGKLIIAAHNAAIERAKADQGICLPIPEPTNEYCPVHGDENTQSQASESWREIAMQTWEEIGGKIDEFTTGLPEDECVKCCSAILAAIERSHAAQPYRSDQWISIKEGLPTPWEGTRPSCEDDPIVQVRLKNGGYEHDSVDYVRGHPDEFTHWRSITEPSPQPKCSEPQEWRGDKDGILWIDVARYHVGNCAARLAFVHNAELGAERQRREQAEESAQAWQDDARAGKMIQKGLHAELLSAQAAIGKSLDFLRSIFGRKRTGVEEWCIKALTTVDLSALREHDKELWKLLTDGRPRAICKHCGYPELIGSDDCRNCCKNFAERIELGDQHDAKVRKPLVDALRQVNDWVLWITEPQLRDEDKRAAKITGIIDDALAKAKDRK